MKQGFTIAKVIENEWFKKGYKPPSFEQTDVSLDDWDAIFDESGASILIIIPVSFKHIFLTLPGQSICQWLIRVLHCT